MRKPASLEKDIFVTVIVLIIVTLYLGILNYSNNASGSIVKARQLTSKTQVLDASRSEHIYLFNTPAQIAETFPDFEADVDWNTNSVLAYVSGPMPNPSYTAELLTAKREANYLNISYRIKQPSETSPILTVVGYPTLFVSVPKTDLIAGSNLFIQFIEKSTGNTKTLTVKPNEI